MSTKGETEFVIPLSLDALQEAPTTRQYAVSNISTCNEIPRRLQECAASFRQQGCDFVCDSQYFDALYSVLYHFKNLDADVRDRSFDLITKLLAKLTSHLTTLLDDVSNLVASERKHWLNVLKMATYLGCNLTEAYESHYNKPSQDPLLGTGKGRKRAGQTGSGGGQDNSGAWEDQRGRMLLQLYSLIQHPLHRLCTPPVMEEDYVNLVSNCCYRILETPSINYSRFKGTRDSIFQIIGTLVNRFNHGLACSLKIMQLVQHFEHLVSVSAQGLALLVNDFGCTTVVSEVVREIAKMDLGSEIASTGSKDNAAVRNYTQFLMELTDAVPQALVPSLPLLFPFLDNENYSLRNCLLTMMGSLVIKVLSREDLDEKNKDLRDNCLDCIEDHAMDVNAFVRSKVLQIILDLVDRGCVPLTRQQQLLELTIGRLMDKSAQVRKNAIALLTAFLKQNPFAAKLPLADLKEQLEMEQNNLRELCPEPLVADDEADKGPTPQQLWHNKLDDVISAVQEALPEDSDSEESEDAKEDALDENCSLNDAVSLIAEALNAGKLTRAAHLLSAALENFHGATVLSYDPSSAPPIQSDKVEELTSMQQKHVALLHRIFLSSQAMNSKNEEEEVEKSKESDEVTKQRTLVNYLKGSVEFAKLVQSGLPLVVQLLSSKLLTDVLEAIKFFVTAFEFGLLDAMSGVREMLVLVWSREQGVQTAVVEAYRRLYINVESTTERARAQQIVKNLTALTAGATLGELASLEEIIAQFMQAGDLTKACITLLWEKFTLALPETTADEAKAALVLLSMAANSEPNIVQSNIQVLITSGLGERGEKDFSLVTEVCSALSKIAITKPKTEASQAPFRLEKNHELFTRLSTILVEGITRDDDNQYSPMALQAVTTIYSLAENPDLICEDIIRSICEKMKNISKGDSDVDPNENVDHQELSLPSFILARFFVLVGRVAIRQLVHLDTFIFSELKRRNHLKEEHENLKRSKKDKKDSNKRKSLLTSASKSTTINKGSSQEEDIDDEMGLTGAVADDVEAEYIRSVCDKEILSNGNMLALCLPLIVNVCANPNKYKEKSLQAAACFALSNFMMVSSDCCEDNLQLLFTILEKSEDPVIRGNTIIALGDLSFRFPNVVEPWTPRLYARLGDECCSVRLSSMTVLTHLILNDMVKVKGQISDIALCITDQEARISGMAKLFFTELSRKQNALYNVLPDIISRLSDPEIKLEEHKYRTIIAHIFGLLQKDKQVEGLVEKLCHRLQATTTARQWRDITYCLSLLNFNDKCLRKLSDLFTCYNDKLHEPDVHKMFLAILAKARKLAKPEAKVMIEELEGKIEKSHDKGVEEQNLVDKAAAAKGGKNNNKKKAGGGGGGGRRRKNSSESEEEEERMQLDDDSDDDVDVAQKLHPAHRLSSTAPRRTSDRVKKTFKIGVEDTSDESEETSDEEEEKKEEEAEDDKEEEEAPKQSRNKKGSVKKEKVSSPPQRRGNVRVTRRR